MHKMDCKFCHSIHSGVHVGLSLYLWWFNVPLYEIAGKVREYDEDWRVLTLCKSQYHGRGRVGATLGS